MSTYLVVRCPRCAGLMLAKASQKTRTCPNCGHRSKLTGLKIHGRTDSSIEAVALIQALKAREVSRSK
jgi:hypothetical protein